MSSCNFILIKPLILVWRWYFHRPLYKNKLCTSEHNISFILSTQFSIHLMPPFCVNNPFCLYVFSVVSKSWNVANDSYDKLGLSWLLIDNIVVKVTINPKGCTSIAPYSFLLGLILMPGSIVQDCTIFTLWVCIKCKTPL